MARAAILGNGNLTVGLDESGLVHDFYFPHVGQDNLTTARSMHHKIGVWVNGNFSWTDDSNKWSCRTELSECSLKANSVFSSIDGQVSIHTIDFVDHKYNFFGRKFYVKNNSDQDLEVRLFLHQVFQISSYSRSDTALYVPVKHYIYNYHGKNCLLISGKSGGESFDQFAVGSYGIEGKKGTYVDAEDGELSGSLVEHAGVDSVIRFKLNIDPGQQKEINYWIVADNSQQGCEQTNNLLLDRFDERLESTDTFWADWLSKSDNFRQTLDDKYKSLFNKSLLLIKAHCDKDGGVIASCDSSIYNYGRDYYNYVWPRDGALALMPLVELGYFDEAKKFIKFCVDVCTDQGYLMHKYQPDKSVGSTWHSLVQNGKPELAIQEDETAILIVLIHKYLEKSGDEDFVRDVYENFVIKAANFMCNYIDPATSLPHGSYDLWEQTFMTSTYTTAVVYRALKCAEDLAVRFGIESSSQKYSSVAEKILQNFNVFVNPDDNTLRKGFVYSDSEDKLGFDNTLDASSFYGIMSFLRNEDLTDVLALTISEVEKKLLNQASAVGVSRYPGDGYFRANDSLPANAWRIATLWLAQYYLQNDRTEDAKVLIDVVQNSSTSSDILSEQVSSLDGLPVSVAPLVWSHAEYLNTMIQFNKKTP